MKKVYITGLFLIVFLFVFATAAQAGPPSNASGVWSYTPYGTGMRQAGCNIQVTTYEESIWQDGTFVGSSTEDGKVTIHCAGNWSFKATVHFDQVEVNGRAGTLEMTVNGSRPDATADWFGYWTITDGSGELENLRGQGTFWGPGAPAPGVQGTIYYAGQIHFQPD